MKLNKRNQTLVRKCIRAYNKCTTNNIESFAMGFWYGQDQSTVYHAGMQYFEFADFVKAVELQSISPTITVTEI